MSASETLAIDPGCRPFGTRAERTSFCRGDQSPEFASTESFARLRRRKC